VEPEGSLQNIMYFCSSAGCH